MKCPKCRHYFDYREGLADEEWRKILELLPAFGGHSRLVWEYVELFGATPLAVKTKKLLRLLGEVAALLVQKKFTWKKAIYEISEKGIVEALTVTCNASLTTPLKDHNYLRAVLAGISEREQKERRDAQDKALRRREVEVTMRPRNDETTKEVDEDRPLSAEENARRAREIAAGIGKRME